MQFMSAVEVYTHTHSRGQLKAFFPFQAKNSIYSYVTKYPKGRIVLHVPYINLTRIPDSLTSLFTVGSTVSPGDGVVLDLSSSAYIKRHTNHNKEKVVTNKNDMARWYSFTRVISHSLFFVMFSKKRIARGLSFSYDQ